MRRLTMFGSYILTRMATAINNIFSISDYLYTVYCMHSVIAYHNLRKNLTHDSCFA